MAEERDLSSNGPDTLDSWIDTVFRNKQIEIHTSLPAIIESFDPETQTASVNLSIKRVKKSGEEITIRPVINVPVVFPSSGGFSVTFPVKHGDEVLVVFSERSLDRWIKFGGVQAPFDRRIHAYTDAVAIIGLHSNVNAISDYSETDLVLRSDDGNAKLTVSQSSIDIDIAGTGGATYNSDGSVVFKNGATITADGDFVNAQSTTFATHKHSTTGTPPVIGS